MFWIIYQKTQTLVWWEPCQDHGLHRKKAHCLPGEAPWSSLYYQERRSKEYPLHRAAQAAWNARFLGCTQELMKSKVTLTKMTWKIFVAFWRRSTVPPVPAHLQFQVQMEPSSYQKRAKTLRGVLNKPVSVNDEAIERLPQVPVNKSLDVTPALEEVLIAIRWLSSGKALGSDTIPAEIYKEGGSALTV